MATIGYVSLILLLGSLFFKIYGYNIKNGIVSFGFGDVLNYSPRYGDLINTSRGAFGSWIGIFEQLDLTVSNAERAMGYPPLLFAVFIAMLVVLFVRKGILTDQLIMLKAFVLTNFLVLAIILTDDQGHTPWFLLYKWVPLMGSARATFRFNILLTFILLVAIAYYFDYRSKTKRSPKKELLLACFLFVSIFAESIRTFPSSWTADDYLPKYASEILTEISSENCQTFL
jgi:hypothetical protein